MSWKFMFLKKTTYENQFQKTNGFSNEKPFAVSLWTTTTTIHFRFPFWRSLNDQVSLTEIRACKQKLIT